MFSLIAFFVILFKCFWKKTHSEKGALVVKEITHNEKKITETYSRAYSCKYKRYPAIFCQTIFKHLKANRLALYYYLSISHQAPSYYMNYLHMTKNLFETHNYNVDQKMYSSNIFFTSDFG